MILDDAVKRARNNENVQRLKGYFLGSIFACITEDSGIQEWTILYYKPTTKSVVDCFVNERFVTVGEETPAINEMRELDMKKVKVNIDTAFSIAAEKFKRKPINTLISLHAKEINKKLHTVWTIAMVTQDMSVTSFDIDATNGKILKEETTKLIKKL